MHENNSELSHLKQALYIIEKLEAKCHAYEQEDKEPIAIIGMGCRFPGGADTPEKYWDVLQQTADVIKEIPSDRWDVDAYYHPALDTQGKMYARSAGFIEEVDQFDAQFFGISPREAKQLDPQQRILLEVAWEALESAGQPISELAESQTGVFIGVSTNDYARKIEQGNGADAYFATGNSFNATAGRLAYFFGFQGPTMAIDTACSSSLVGVHLACQSLRHKESKMALAGGVNLILSPENSIALSRIHALSPTDRCKAFDQGADGYVRGEGCGVVVLKRLSDAIKENDNVLGVILGSAVNQDGHSSGLTVPNRPSQQKLIRQALTNAQVPSDRIDYIEAHGTGTPLGDPIEVRALGDVFKKGQSDTPLYIGTAKANIGHLEAAAGIAGLIKVILALKHESIPAQLNFKQPSPHIPWDELRLKVPTEKTSWLRKEKLRCAGISGFGFTGTNAHLVVSEAAEHRAEVKKTEPYGSIHVLTISGKVEEALRENVRRVRDYLARDLTHSIEDICYTASVCRDHFHHRLAVIGRTKEELCLKLGQFLRQGSPFSEEPIEVEAKQESLRRLYTLGHSINWKEYYGNGPYKKVGLPTYAFQRERFWPEHKINVPIHSNQHPLLGKKLPFSFSEDLCFETQLSPLSPSFLNDHRLFNAVVVPAASHISALLLAAQQAFPSKKTHFEDLFFPEALVIADTDICSVQLSMTQENQAHRSVQIKSLSQNKDPHDVNSWASHALGKLVFDEAQTHHLEPVDSVLVQSGQRWDQNEIYSILWGLGYTLGNAFRWMETVWVFEDQLLCKLTTPPAVTEAEEYILHPGLLDSCFQLLACAKLKDKDFQDFYLPFSIKKVRSFKKYAASPQTWCHMKIQSPSELEPSLLSADFQLYDENNEMITEVIGFQARKAKAEVLLSTLQREKGRDLYRVSWSVQPRKVKNPLVRMKKTNHWLVFVDTIEMADELAAQLGNFNIECIFVFVDNFYHQSFENERRSFYINPENQTHFQQLIHAVTLEESIECQHVLFLWSLEKEKSRLDVPLLLDAQKKGCMSVIHLVKALVQSNGEKIPQLWLFTSGCQQVDGFDTPIDLKFAPLRGLRSVIGAEHPELRPVCIDLDPSDCNVELMINAILQPDDETEIALRNRLPYVARLESFPENRPFDEKLSIDKNGSYLVTGGLGGIGLQVVQWLFEQGARNLILIGRSGASLEADKILTKLEEKGAEILLLKLDISDSEQLKKGFIEIGAKMPPLKGVIHAAGVVKDSSIVNETWANFNEVISPKVLGGYYLHLMTQQMKLDFFVCFSSIAAMLGSVGQGAYAAANMFLDTLISYRRRLGLPGLSLNWGLWAGLGMAAKLENKQRERLESFGLGFISPFSGLKILEESIKKNVSQLLVMPIDWSKFLTHFDGNIPSFFNFQKRYPVQRVTSSPLLKQLENTPYEERKILLSKSVSTMLAEVLQLSSGDLIDVNQGFFDLGLDSLMALELKEKIERDLGVQLPSTLMFNYPNTFELVDYLMKKITSVEPSNSSPIHPKVDPVASLVEVEELSNDEVTKMLLEKFK